MTEKERESSERKKTLKKTSENNCPHIINMRLGKHLSLCKECGTMIYTEKILKYTFKKHLVKPINYCKGNDVSPLKKRQVLLVFKSIFIYKIILNTTYNR